ncbi:MAG: hypothetical protein ACTSQY_09500 [Candidatus Odinarchaeia archaeon]
MGTSTKTAGRRTTMKLPTLKLKNPKDVWKEYQTVGWMAVDSGYTPTAIRQWIRQKKIKGWLLSFFLR